MTHTKGRWYRSDKGRQNDILADNPVRPQYPIIIASGVLKENMPLIIAAPDLLAAAEEALEAVRRAFVYEISKERALTLIEEHLQAALKKARVNHEQRS